MDIWQNHLPMSLARQSSAHRRLGLILGRSLNEPKLSGRFLLNSSLRKFVTPWAHKILWTKKSQKKCKKNSWARGLGSALVLSSWACGTIARAKLSSRWRLNPLPLLNRLPLGHSLAFMLFYIKTQDDVNILASKYMLWYGDFNYTFLGLSFTKPKWHE